MGPPLYSTLNPSILTYESKNETQKIDLRKHPQVAKIVIHPSLRIYYSYKNTRVMLQINLKALFGHKPNRALSFCYLRRIFT